MSTTTTTTTTTEPEAAEAEAKPEVSPAEQWREEIVKVGAALKAAEAAEAKRSDALAKVEERTGPGLISKAIAFAMVFDRLKDLAGLKTDSNGYALAGIDKSRQPVCSRLLGVGRYVPAGTEHETWHRYTEARWEAPSGAVYTNAGTWNDLHTWCRVVLATAEAEARSHKTRLSIDDVVMTRAEYVERSAETKAEAETKAAEEAKAAEAKAEAAEIVAEAKADGQPDLMAAVRMAFIGCDVDTIKETADLADLSDLSPEDVCNVAMAALALIKLAQLAKAEAEAKPEAKPKPKVSLKA